MANIVRQLALSRFGINAAVSVFAGFAGQGILILTGLLTARILGVDDRGNLAFITLVCVAMASLLHLGIPFAATHFIAKSAETARRTIQGALLLQNVQSLLILPLTILIFYTYFEANEENHLLVVSIYAAPGVIGLLSHFYGMAILQGLGAFSYCNILRLVPLINFSLLLLLLWFGQSGSLDTVAAAWSLGNLAGGFITYRIAKNLLSLSYHIDSAPTNPNSLKELIGFGLKSLVGTTSPIETLRIDQFLIAIFFNAHALGLYVVAQSFNNLPRFASHSIGMVLSPHISGMPSEQKKMKTIWSITVASIAINAIAALLLAACMNWLISFFFGYAFSEAAEIAPMMLAGAVALAGRRVLCDGLRGFGHPSIATYAELITYIVMAILWIPLSSAYGLAGAAACVSAAHLFALLTAIMLAYIKTHRSRITET